MHGPCRGWYLLPNLVTDSIENCSFLLDKICYQQYYRFQPLHGPGIISIVRNCVSQEVGVFKSCNIWRIYTNLQKSRNINTYSFPFTYKKLFHSLGGISTREDDKNCQKFGKGPLIYYLVTLLKPKNHHYCLRSVSQVIEFLLSGVLKSKILWTKNQHRQRKLFYFVNRPTTRS